MPASDPERLEELLADALAAHDAGGEAGVQAFLAAHPQDRAALERGLSRARQMGLCGEAPPAAEFPDRLGEFKLLRRLGSGGMGVVYEAEQASLGRRVALKVVRPELLYFEGARERFRREIEAVARLSHPSIVPVLASGEQDGVPWYAMELLHGRSLQQLTAALHGGRDGRDIGELRGADLRAALAMTGETGTDPFDGSWWQIAARIAHSVALGVRHAHVRGIVHRDIKPGNVMLTQDGRTVLLDFGVARVGGGDFTRTGNTPGSPAFMSPEQLRGDAVDERTDVYSLGATLWQLLTLQAPFAAQGDARRILAGEVQSPRKLYRDLPRDLELVVLTAMDVDRERRYHDMQAFADDLMAVLQRRPIRARRLGVPLRVLRWSQRHRAGATAIGCAVAAALLLPLVVAWRERAVNRELAEAARLADESLTTSLDAIYSLLVHVGEERLRYVPAARQVAIDSIDEAVAMYRTLLPRHPAHLRLRVDAGKAAGRLADLVARNGHGDRAMSLLREAEDWLAAVPATPDVVLGRVYTALNEADLRQSLDDRAGAQAAAARAETALAQLEATAVHDVECMRCRMRCDVLRGDLHFNAEEYAPAEGAYRAALERAREVAARPTGNPSDLQTLVHRQKTLATLLVRLGRFDEARPLLDEALVLARALPAAARIWPPPPCLVADVCQTLGNLLVERRDLAAVPFLKECLQLRQAVAQDHPSDLMLRSEVAAALHNLARLNYQQAQDDLVVERLLEAAELQRQVRAELPTFVQARDYLRNHLSLLGSSLAKLGRRGELERVAAELSGLDDPIGKRRAARLWLRCVELLDAAQATVTDAGSRRGTYLDQAMHNLLDAERLGWGSGSGFRDKVYDPLREREDFTALTARIAARQSTAVSPPSTSNASRETPR